MNGNGANAGNIPAKIQGDIAIRSGHNHPTARKDGIAGLNRGSTFDKSPIFGALGFDKAGKVWAFHNARGFLRRQADRRSEKETRTKGHKSRGPKHPPNGADHTRSPNRVCFEMFCGDLFAFADNQG